MITTYHDELAKLRTELLDLRLADEPFSLAALDAWLTRDPVPAEVMEDARLAFRRRRGETTQVQSA